MKKKRGLRRYFKALNKKELNIHEVWINDGFVSYDKLWIDYYGFKGIRKRKPHLECLIKNYERLTNQISNLSSRFQIWIMINEFNSYQDCIFLHSPNTINEFPHKEKHYSFENNFKNKDLVYFIDQHTSFNKIFGTYFVENDLGNTIQENFCVLYKDGIGEPII